MTTVAAYAAPAAKAPLERTTIERRAVREFDVLIDIKFAGICHSDIHQVREGWGAAIFPMVPGHEIAGLVSQVGPGVTRYKVGDRVGVGCMVDSCRECDNCKAGQEQHCVRGNVQTYNAIGRDGEPTYGGYSTHVVVDENFVVRIPGALALDAAAPLLCAGITTYAPLKQWGAAAGKKVAVIGLGGLGHVGVPEEPVSFHPFSLIGGNKILAGSMIGGIPETQEMLDFCAAQGIGAEIERIAASEINEAYERVTASDVRYRFVIDTATI